MFHTPSLHADTVTGPQLAPFRLHHVCPACGAAGTILHRMRQKFFGGDDRHMFHVFCDGGKEPTEEHNVATLTGAVRVEHRHICAGITGPHLHVTCANCKYQMLTQTRTRAEATYVQF